MAAASTQAGSNYIDSRDEQVTFDYNKLTINCGEFSIIGPSYEGTTANPTMVYKTRGQVTNPVGQTVTPLFSFTTASNHVYLIKMKLTGYNLVGGPPGTTFLSQTLSRALNNAGAMTINAGWSNIFHNPSALGGTGMSVTNLDVVVTVNAVQAITYSMRWTYEIEISVS